MCFLPFLNILQTHGVECVCWLSAWDPPAFSGSSAILAILKRRGMDISVDKNRIYAGN